MLVGAGKKFGRGRGCFFRPGVKGGEKKKRKQGWGEGVPGAVKEVLGFF